MADKNWKIAFLDAATVDLGDLNMGALKRLGPYRSVPFCPKGKVPQKLRDSRVVITNKVFLGPTQLDSFSDLKLIAVAATGVNNVDLDAARERGIAVCNVAGYSTPTVVEHALMFLLAFSHRLLEHHQAVVSGQWSRSPFFSLLKFPFSDLEGKVLGIVGYGHIGKKVGILARVLGMKLMPAKIPHRHYSPNSKRYSLNRVLREADFLVLHTALTPQTRGLINRETLKKMKAGAYLLNLARGPVVVEKDVARALEKNQLAGYASDVTEVEPLPKNNPLLKKFLANKVLLTPHVAWASRESRQRLIQEIAENIAAFQKGRKRNRII